MNELMWGDIRTFFNHPRLLTRATGGARKWTREKMCLLPRDSVLCRSRLSIKDDVFKVFAKILARSRQRHVIGWYVEAWDDFVQYAIITRSAAANLQLNLRCIYDYREYHAALRLIEEFNLQEKNE